MKKQVLTQKQGIFIFTTVLLFLVIQSISYGQGSAKIYWEESDRIRRANLDGSNVEDIITGLKATIDIDLDLDNRKIYWIGNAYSKIYRANLDGSDIETIIDGEKLIADPDKHAFSPINITLDPLNGKIYWGNWTGRWGISRADYDGSIIEDIRIAPVDGGLFAITVDAENIQLDVKAGKIYFVDSLNDNIARVNFDGSNYENLGISIVDPYGLALDLENRLMYWTHVSGRIRRASLNGENIETLLTELKGPSSIALDIDDRKMYWVERGKYIRSANLDGTNVTDILTGMTHIGGIALDTEGVYDVAPDTNKLTTTWAEMKNE